MPTELPPAPTVGLKVCSTAPVLVLNTVTTCGAPICSTAAVLLPVGFSAMALARV